MKNVVLAIVCTFLLIVDCIPPSQQTIQRRILRSTVMVRGGAGTVIRSTYNFKHHNFDNYILTAAHVVKKPGNVVDVFFGKFNVSGGLVDRHFGSAVAQIVDDKLDYAIIKGSSPFYVPAVRLDCLHSYKVLEPIYVAGQPNGRVFWVNCGYISCLTLGEKSNVMFGHSANCTFGSSGGPVFDSEGNQIGMNVSISLHQMFVPLTYIVNSVRISAIKDSLAGNYYKYFR